MFGMTRAGFALATRASWRTMRSLIVLFLLLGSLFAKAEEIRVAAAASLAEAVTEVAAAWQKTNGGKAVPVFAGSNVLARQIEEGAPLDVFISADSATMENLAQAKLVRNIEPLLTNSLVVVVSAESDLKITRSADLQKLKHIAIGDPSAVPAGVYAKTWLTSIKLWQSVEPRCIGTENVRAALAAIEAGNVDAAIVYRTDAAISKKVRIAWSVPENESPEIIYPFAICSATKHPDAAKRFTDFLKSEESRKIFSARGFGLVEK